MVSRVSRDPADRLLEMALRLMPAARQEWGLAMGAELAQLERTRDRGWFAVGCLRVALWQGPLWRIIGSLASQAVVVAVALLSGLTGSFAGEVIGLILLLPPGLWWLGRDTAHFGQSGVPRAARIARRVGYGMVAACLVVTVGFMTVTIPQVDQGVAAATVWLGIVMLLLSGYLLAVLAVTSARSLLSAGTVTTSATIGAIGGLVWLAVLPFNQPLGVTGWWTSVYPATLALPLVAAPAVAGVLAARRGQDVYHGVLAGGCTGAVTALVATTLGGTAIWLRPELVDSGIIDRGPSVLPPDVISVAGSYLLVLLALPVIGIVCGAIGGRLTARWQVPTTVLVAVAALSYPFVATLNQQDVPQFGNVGATSVTFTPNGRALLAGADGGMTTSLWDLSDPAHPVRTVSVNRTALFSPDGHVMASEDQLWNVTDPRRPTHLAGFDGGDPVAFSPDGRELSANLHNSNQATLWNVADPTHPVRLSTVGGSDQGAFTPNDSVYATSSSDSPATTTLWSLDGVRLATVAGTEPVFSPDGHLLATRADDGTVQLWNMADPTRPQRLAVIAGGGDMSLATPVVFAPNGHLMVTDNPDGSTQLWHVDDLSRAGTLVPVDGAGNGQIGVSSTLTTSAFSPDSRTFAVEMGNDTVMVWNVGDPDHPVRTAVHTRKTAGAGVVAFTPDLSSVVGTAPDGSNTVALWHLR
jgi:WD40 repeat protein